MSFICKTGNVFDIERFATKDGPGIRTVIFLKGCNLRCDWCQNPESQESKIQILYDSKKCISCGRCVASCKIKAIEFSPSGGTSGDLKTIENLCNGCGECVESCFFDARKISGKYYTVSELMEIILKDKAFYEKSNGGVTFSGGEPLLQSEFLREILAECKGNNINTAVETAGNVPFECLGSVSENLDLIYYDVKHVDDAKHFEFTGCHNSSILGNLKKITEIHRNVIVRIPIIPSFNSDTRDLKNIFSFLKEIEKIKAIELLPFHRLGESKYRFLGRNYEYGEVKPLESGYLEHLKEIGMNYGLNML